MSFDLDRIQARVERMSEGELLDWLGTALPGMQRHLDAYNRTRDKDHFGELAIAEMTANLVVTELMGRFFGKPVPADEPPPVPSAPSELKTDTSTTSARRLFRRRRGHVPAQQGDTND